MYESTLIKMPKYFWKSHVVAHTISLKDLVLRLCVTCNIFYSGPDGQFFSIGDDDGVCSEDSPTEFIFEFRGQSVLAIKAPNGCYLKGEQSGVFRAVSNEINSASLWEF